MDKRALDALRGSIKKWELIVKGEIEDKGTENCPLCVMFCSEPNFNCAGCPVAEKTGKPGCQMTPYMGFRNAVIFDSINITGENPVSEGDRFKYMVIGPKSQQAAIDEYNFLVSLLP